jgi:hypothetical protein
MKTEEYAIQLENFERFFEYLHSQHPEIMGAEWDSDKQTLKIHYEDKATPLTLEALQNLQIPTVLKFRKKVTPPDLGIADTTVKAITENEFTVETQQPEEVRKKVKELYTEFEEIQ